MFNRIKFWLLCRLLRDICKKSHCYECDAVVKGEILCGRSYVVMQARKVWEIGRR